MWKCFNIDEQRLAIISDDVHCTVNIYNYKNSLKLFSYNRLKHDNSIIGVMLLNVGYLLDFFCCNNTSTKIT